MTPNLYYSLIYYILTKSKKAPNIIKKYATGKYNNLINTPQKRDTPILTRLNNNSFLCPFSHRLLFHQKQFPLYDRQLSKLCNYLQTEKGHLSIIDVGANVGDTVINIGNKQTYYLCIEGNPFFSKYIKYNLRNYHYSLECVYLSDTESNQALDIEMSNGTAHLVKGTDYERKIPLVTLDSLLESKYPNINFDLIKIDTDGFDFKVIRGSINYIKKSHPFLFFEWDKKYCQEQSENPLSIFSLLEHSNYSHCILFDNFGNPLSIIKTNDTETLHSYINNTIGDNLPYYYDVLAVPNEDITNIDSIYQIFN